MTSNNIVIKHFEELREKYKALAQIYWQNTWSVEGRLQFIAVHNEKPIEDAYYVKISLPRDYPIQHPTAEETLGRIPKTFHHYQDGHLCLGAPFAVQRLFMINPTLVGFTENCLIPYLYSFSYLSLYGELPYGELPHGWISILEYYQTQFRVSNKRSALELLKILSENYQSKNNICPCGSRKTISKCHGNQLSKMLLVQEAFCFEREYNNILSEISSRMAHLS